MTKKIFVGVSIVSLLVFCLIFGVNFILNNPLSGVLVRNDFIPASPELMLGANFVVGIPGKVIDEPTRKLLEDIKPAGIVLYYRNYQDRLQFKSLISELQKIANNTTGYSYFIMIDEEPGGATRLDLFNHVFDSGTPDWERINKDIKYMASLGINVDLAPLADFPFNKDTFIKQRIAAHTPKALIDFNTKFIALLQSAGISATLKHFPGMGVFVEDPHKTIPHNSYDENFIDKSIQIFRKGVDDKVDFVMTGHGVYDALDLGIPATLSKRIVTGILREDLKFEGLIITDDLSDMPFIIGENIDIVEGTIEAIKAGHNLVIFSHEPKITKNVYDGILNEMKVNKELATVLNKNYEKVRNFKIHRD